MKKINYQHKGLNVHLISALAILTAIASPWFDLSVSNHSFVKTYVAGIGAIILVLISLWVKRNESHTNFHISAVKASLLALFALGTLSVFWSVNVDFTITKWMIWFTILCAFVVGYHLKLDDKTIMKLCWGLLISTLVVAGIGILQYLFDPFTLTQAASPSSTFGNKNMATQPIVLILPLALFVLSSNQTTNKQAWIVATIASLMLIFIFYAHTRASWVSIIIENILIAGFLLLKRKTLSEWISWNPTKTKASLFALGLFLLMVNFDKDGFNWFLDGVISAAGGAKSSGNVRFDIWAITISMIKASPLFGSGLGTWFHNEMQGGFDTWNVNSYQRAHNDVLEIGAEVGLVGIGLFLISVVSIIIAGIKIINQGTKVFALFFLLILVALSGSFVQMQFSFPYQLAMPALLFGLYTGMIAKHSENFIKPLKLIKRKTSNIYHQSIKVFWLILLVVVSSIYIEWINTYSTLNKINLNGKFDQIEKNIPSIYHLELQNMLGFLSQAYFKSARYDVVIIVEENILRHWPNANHSLYRYAHALKAKKRINDALKVVQHFKKVAEPGNYKGHILELQIYRQTKQFKKYRKAFDEFKNADEKLLSLSVNSYKFLIFSSFYLQDLSQYTQGLYDKYDKYHPYQCSMESSMASFYTNKKQYKKARKHVDTILASKNSKCLNPAIVKTLEKQGF